MFEEVVNACAPTHFTRAEAPILGLYCNAIHLARFYSGKIGTGGARGENHRWWVENTRLAASLATKLRLTPQTRFDGRAAEGRRALDQVRPALPGITTEDCSRQTRWRR